MCLATAKLFQLFQCLCGIRVTRGIHRERNQNLVGVEARILGAEVVNLQRLYGFNDSRGNQFDFIRNVAECLDGI